MASSDLLARSAQVQCSCCWARSSAAVASCLRGSGRHPAAHSLTSCFPSIRSSAVSFPGAWRVARQQVRPYLPHKQPGRAQAPQEAGVPMRVLPASGSLCLALWTSLLRLRTVVCLYCCCSLFSSKPLPPLKPGLALLSGIRPCWTSPRDGRLLRCLLPVQLRCSPSATAHLRGGMRSIFPPLALLTWPLSEATSVEAHLATAFPFLLPALRPHGLS